MIYQLKRCPGGGVTQKPNSRNSVLEKYKTILKSTSPAVCVILADIHTHTWPTPYRITNSKSLHAIFKNIEIYFHFCTIPVFKIVFFSYFSIR